MANKCWYHGNARCRCGSWEAPADLHVMNRGHRRSIRACAEPGYLYACIKTVLEPPPIPYHRRLCSIYLAPLTLRLQLSNKILSTSNSPGARESSFGMSVRYFVNLSGEATLPAIKVNVRAFLVVYSKLENVSRNIEYIFDRKTKLHQEISHVQLQILAPSRSPLHTAKTTFYYHNSLI
jgi:hypothetical protein